MSVMDPSDSPDIVGIPIKGGITEGGLLLLAVMVVVIAALILATLLVFRYGNRISNMIKQVRQDTANANEQISNNHKTNFREDFDSAHSKLYERLEDIHKKIDKNAEQVNNRFDSMNERISGIDARLNNWKH